MNRKRRWIRLDVDWDKSKWLRRLQPNARRLWPPFLCYVKVWGVRGRCRRLDVETLADELKAEVAEVDALLSAAIADGAIEVVNEGADWSVVNWEQYQEIDRTNAERQARHREKQRLANNLRVVDGAA